MDIGEQEQRAKHIALDLLSRREHSALELKRKIERHKNLVDVDIDALIAELIKNDWLSHHRFAQSFIRSRRNKGQGPVKITYELRQRGLQDAEFVDFINEVEDWHDLAYEVLSRRFEASGNDVKAIQKQQRFLAQRGFQFEQIKYATQQLNRRSD
ncbi:MAG: regulatory protein RecX [Enterobacterales bacterium]|nr:regulatory protein RecX [Enterobacterales bacterium]